MMCIYVNLRDVVFRVCAAGLLVALSFLWTEPLYSQDQRDPDSTAIYELEPVVITGTAVQVARRNLPLTVSTLSESEIRQSTESNLLPMLTGRIPGLFVTERGITGFGVASGSAGQISIRGVGSSPNTGVLVLVDGHPQFMGLMGHPLPDTYVSSDAERVEVVRGPASILYGTAAMGGVVNVITRRQEEPGAHLEGRVVYGSYNTQKYNAGAGYRGAPLAVYGSINHDRTDGHRDGSDFDITNGFLKADVAVSPAFRITADGGLSAFKALDPGTLTTPFPNGDHWADITRGRTSVSLENRINQFEGALRLYHSFGDHEISDGFISDDYNTGLTAYQSIHLRPGSSVTVGADFKRYGGKARNTIAGRNFGKHTVTEAAGYALVQHRVNGLFTATAGSRIEHNSLFGSFLVPQLGVAAQATASMTVKASVARGFRSPTIRELYLFPAPNPDLEPERLWNYELGILYTRSNWSAELTGFVIEGDNLIQVSGAFPNLQTRNTGSFSHRGVETQVTVRPITGLEFVTSYSYLFTDDPVTAAPRHLGFAEGIWRAGRWSLNAQFQYVAGLVTQIRPTLNREEYLLLNGGASWSPLRYLDVFVRAENLLDRSYQINEGYPMPGITLFSGINLRY